MPVSFSQVAKRADEFFMGASPIHTAMHRLAESLGELQIPFAVAGAMAVNEHGHKRTTEDLVIIIRSNDLTRFKQRHLGLGWVDKFEGSKNFRDAVCDVNIDTLLVGAYPGDGQPKPIAFPEPESVAEISDDGIPYVSLNTLLELKMASGMTAPHRPRDLDDVIQLIGVLAIAGHYIMFKAFQPPIVADAQGALVIVMLPAYQWVAIVSAYPFACLLFGFIEWLSGLANGYDQAEETP